MKKIDFNKITLENDPFKDLDGTIQALKIELFENNGISPTHQKFLEDAGNGHGICLAYANLTVGEFAGHLFENHYYWNGVKKYVKMLDENPSYKEYRSHIFKLEYEKRMKLRVWSVE